MTLGGTSRLGPNGLSEHHPAEPDQQLGGGAVQLAQPGLAHSEAEPRAGGRARGRARAALGRVGRLAALAALLVTAGIFLAQGNDQAQAADPQNTILPIQVSQLTLRLEPVTTNGIASAVTEGQRAYFTIALVGELPAISNTAVEVDFSYGDRVLNVQPSTASFRCSGACPQRRAYQIPQGERTVRFWATLGDNNTDEATGTLEARLVEHHSHPTGSPDRATVQVLDNDKPSVSLASVSTSVTEGGPAPQFTLTLPRAQEEEIEVHMTLKEIRGGVTLDRVGGRAFSEIIPVNTRSITFEVPLTDDEVNMAPGQLEVEVPTVSAANVDYAVDPNNVPKATVAITEDDPYEVWVTADQDSVVEGETANFTVHISQAQTTNTPLFDVQVTETRTRTSDRVYTRTVPVSVPAGATGAPLWVATHQDSHSDPNGQIVASLVVPSPASSIYKVVTAPTGAAATAVVDNDGSPKFTVTRSYATEDEDLTFVVRLQPAVNSPTSVNYAVGEATAKAGEDYATDGTSGKLRFAANETRKTVTINVTDDELDELDEHLSFALNSPIGAQLGTRSIDGSNTSIVSGTIIDNDVPVLTIARASLYVTEGDNAVYTVTASTPPAQDLVVPVNVTESHNYILHSSTNPPPTIMFPKNQNTATYTVLVDDDDVKEEDTWRAGEGIAVRLLPGAGYTVPLRGRTAVVQVYDDDFNDNDAAYEFTLEAVATTTLEGWPAKFRLRSSYEQGSACQATVAITAPSGFYEGPSSMTVELPRWGTSKEFLIPTVGDEVDERHGTLTATLQAPTGDSPCYRPGSPASASTRIIDDERDIPTISFAEGYTQQVAEGERVTGTIVSSFELTEPRNIHYTVTDQNGDTHQLSVPLPADSLTVDVSFLVADDNVDEPDRSVTIAIPPRPQDYELGERTSFTASVPDDDDPPVVNLVCRRRWRRDRGAVKARIWVFTARLAEVSGYPVTVNYRTEELTFDIAKSNVDFEAVTNGVLNFAAGVQEQPIRIRAQDR